jgi:hypothetical protein
VAAARGSGLAKLADQGGFADPGGTLDEQCAPAAEAGLGQQRACFAQVVVAFE